MNYGQRQAMEIMERYNRAFDRALQLRSKKESYKKTDQQYWQMVDKVEQAQARCRLIDRELQDHLKTIKPNIYEQVRIY